MRVLRRAPVSVKEMRQTFKEEEASTLNLRRKPRNWPEKTMCAHRRRRWMYAGDRKKSVWLTH